MMNHTGRDWTAGRRLREVAWPALALMVLAAVACSEATETGGGGTGPETRAEDGDRDRGGDRSQETSTWRARDASPPFLEANIQSLGAGGDVLVALERPDSAVGALPTNSKVRVARDGRVVYEHHGDLYVMVADPVLRDPQGTWTYPEDPADNDKRLATPDCRGSQEGFSFPDAIGWFWIDPEGRIAYRCPRQLREPALHYVDGATEEMSEGQILSLGSQSRALLEGGPYGETWGIDDRGFFTPIDRPKSWRRLGAPILLADEDGFLAAFLNKQGAWDQDGLGTLFRIYYDGTVEDLGPYGSPEESLRAGQISVTLAPGGDLYVVHRRNEDDVVVRFRPSFGETGEVVYRVASGAGTFYRDPWQPEAVVKWGG